MHRYSVLVTSQIQVEGNLKCSCIPYLSVPQIVFVSKTLQPEKITGVGSVTGAFKVFVPEGLLRFSNFVSSGYLLFFGVFLPIAVPLVSKLVFSLTSLRIRSLLVERY